MAERITGAEAVVRSLMAEGVDRVFGYPGGAIISVYDRLYDHTQDITHVLARHEQGAIHAAQGYARVTNRPGVVIVTSGPGAANVVTGLSDALIDSTPIVMICGQVESRLLGCDAFQETDVVGITQPITKWSLQVRRPEDVQPAIARAFYIATTGRPGPVVIDLSKDAQVGLCDWDYKKLRYIRSYIPRPVVSPSVVVNAANLINSAKRPLILSGHGVMIAEAEAELLELAEKADIPVATTLLGLSTIPTGHRLNKGMLGMHGNIGPNYLTNHADVIIAIGMRFDDRVTSNIAKYAPDAKIVHVDIDSSEFNRNVEAHISVHGDARDVLQQLTPLVDEAKRPEWLEQFDICNQVETDVVKSAELHHDGLLTMGEVVHCVAQATKGGDAILVTDVGQNQMMSARYFCYSQPRSIVTSGGVGTMGFGLPAAIGAKMGAPDRTVCFFSGDGGFQMTIQELGTIMQYGTAVKMIVLNNNFLGNVRQWQDLFFKSRFSQTPMLNPDFCAIARAYGIPTEAVDTREQLQGAVDRMMAADGPYLLNVRIDETDNVFPMVPLGASVDDIMLNRNQRFIHPSKQ